jgi:hypothetical protein
MTDISHYFGEDLSWSPTGDLAVAGTPEVTTQRVLRRLMTAPLSYLWNLGYGAGLPAMVGQVASASAIRGAAGDQMLQEAGVLQSPPPTVKVKVTNTGFVFAEVAYGDAATGTTQPLTVPLS